MSETKGYWWYEEDVTKLNPEREPTKEELKEQRKREKAAELVDNMDKDLLLKNLEENMNSFVFEVAEWNFKSMWEGFYVPSEVVEEFLNKIKEVWKELLLATELTDEQLKSLFWDDVSVLKKYPMFQWDVRYFIPLYYIKKLCPENYVNIMDAMIHIFMGFDDMVSEYWTLLNAKIKNSEEAYKYLYDFVKKYWSESANLLKYLVAKDWTYLRDWTIPLVKALSTDNQETSQAHEPLAVDVRSEWNASIENDWNNDFVQVSWEVRISESVQEWIIDETQTDDFKLKQDYYESLWTAIQFYESFIFEPEWVNLFEYLKDNPVKLSNLWWKVINEIDLNTEKWINFCFHWILSMVKTRGDIECPVYRENMSKKEKDGWKKQWDRIIKEYETVLRNYIAQDFTTNEKWERVEKPREETFDKVFYLSSQWDLVIDRFHLSTDVVQWLSLNPVADYSYKKTGDEAKDNESAYIKSDQFADELRMYMKEHPNDKILVCISEHWKPDWSSWNDWDKEDWLYLANMSPNLKIWSIRCYFWTAFERDQIAQQKSSVSWYSNLSPTWWPVTEVINEASRLWLWYHEMEIYSRLKYLSSVSPLTESMSYTNWNTWETEMWKIWLAQNDWNNWNTDSVDVA